MKASSFTDRPTRIRCTSSKVGVMVAPGRRDAMVPAAQRPTSMAVTGRGTWKHPSRSAIRP
jgi:hypothetical protein